MRMIVFFVFAVMMSGVMSAEGELGLEEWNKVYRSLHSLSVRELIDLDDRRLKERMINCGEYEYNCLEGNVNTCLPFDKLCDGTEDCTNGADEGTICSLACGRRAGMTEEQWHKGYLCRKNAFKCLTEEQKCDDVVDCPNDPNEGTAALGCDVSKKSASLKTLLERYIHSIH